MTPESASEWLRIRGKVYLIAKIESIAIASKKELRGVQLSLDPYSEPRLLVRIVEAGSLRAVADELGAEPSTITRRLLALERRLGAKLIERSRVRSRPTEVGQRYYEHIKYLLGEIDGLEADVAGETERPRGVLRVAAPSDFGTRFVAPVAEELLNAHTDLEVELQLGSHYVDLIAGNVDVAVRIGELADVNLVARKLGAIPRMTVASPRYLQRNGTPVQPEDLRHHNYIFYRQSRGADTVHFHGPNGEQRVRVRGRFTVNNITAVRNALIAGLGLHTGPVWAFAEEVEAGRLVEVLPEYRAPSPPVNALWVPAPFIPAKTRTFVDLIVNRFQSAPGISLC